MKWGAIILVAIGGILSPLPALADDRVCEAIAIYYEANTEPLEGKRAVLDVIRNRASALGKSSCEIVKQKGQFSFVHKRFKWRATNFMLTTRDEVRMIAPVCEKCWYFNAGKRIRKYKFIRRIAGHNFYRR